jgi:hypothetical protein
MPLPSANISVTEPITLAIDRVKKVLFQPFDLGKWFVIGFSAWLASLGEAGLHGGYNFGSPGGGGGGGGVGFDDVRDFVVRNLYWIVPVAIIVIAMAIAVWVLLTWLSSRGRFMFLYCVAMDRAEVVEPWKRFVREGNSLFLFRIALGAIGTVMVLPLLTLTGLLIYRMVEAQAFDAGRIAGIATSGLAVAVVSLTFFIVGKFTTDFVVPIMFVKGRSCRESWRDLLGLLSGNVGEFVLYLLFQIVLSIALAVIVFGLVIGTCCLAGCVLVLPYLGTVLLLPLAMFRRCYSASYLAQFGREYDAFGFGTALTPPSGGLAS